MTAYTVSWAVVVCTPNECPICRSSSGADSSTIPHLNAKLSQTRAAVRKLQVQKADKKELHALRKEIQLGQRILPKRKPDRVRAARTQVCKLVLSCLFAHC